MADRTHLRRRLRSRLAELGVANVLLGSWVISRGDAAIRALLDGEWELATAFVVMGAAGAGWLLTRLHRNLLRDQLRCARTLQYEPTPVGPPCMSWAPDLISGKRHWCTRPAHRNDAHECRCRMRWGNDCLG